MVYVSYKINTRWTVYDKTTYSKHLKKCQDGNTVLSDCIASKEEMGYGYESKYLNGCIYTY